MLHDLADILGRRVCSISNNSIRTGYIPEVWKSANVTSLPKVRPLSQIETDLRSVSLTAILIKELEGFIYKWLWDVLKYHIGKDHMAV